MRSTSSRLKSTESQKPSNKRLEDMKKSLIPRWRLSCAQFSYLMTRQATVRRNKLMTWHLKTIKSYRAARRNGLCCITLSLALRDFLRTKIRRQFL